MPLLPPKTSDAITPRAGRSYRVTAALDTGVGGRSQSLNAIAGSATTGATGSATVRSCQQPDLPGVLAIA